MVQRECKPCPDADMQWSVYLSALVLPIVMMVGGLVFLFWAGACWSTLVQTSPPLEPSLGRAGTGPRRHWAAPVLSQRTLPPTASIVRELLQLLGHEMRRAACVVAVCVAARVPLDAQSSRNDHRSWLCVAQHWGAHECWR